MSARQKLNTAVITGALLTAILVGAISGSSGAALATGLGLLMLGLSNGSYRADPSPPPPRRRRSRR